MGIPWSVRVWGDRTAKWKRAVLSHVSRRDVTFDLKGNCDMTVNAPPQPLSGNMDVDEFMAFLETRPDEEHWELIEGVAVMMAPASYAHQRITYNFCNLLNNAFAAQRLDLFAYFDVGVRSPGVRNFQPQPDVAVVPGVAGFEYYSERFKLAGEVLSPTNTRQEIPLKLRRYRETPDNLYAVVIEPREFLVEIHARTHNWEPLILKQSSYSIKMPEFGLHCIVADLYSGTPLDPSRSST
jgi:Uma2 family endonuclease